MLSSLLDGSSHVLDCLVVFEEAGVRLVPFEKSGLDLEEKVASHHVQEAGSDTLHVTASGDFH